MKRMAIISAGFVPVPAVDGGAVETLTTEIIIGNESKEDYYIDIYTIESPKLNNIKYNNAEIIQIHISVWMKLLCKVKNAFLKFFRRKYRFIPYNQELLRVFRDVYDVILVENNMQVYEDIYNSAKKGTNNMIYHMHNDIDGSTKPEYLCKFIAETAKDVITVSNYIKNRFCAVAPNREIKVLYNCVDMKIFNSALKYNTKEIKKKYGIQDKDYVFMYTGRISEEKGTFELIKAFKLLCKNKEVRNCTKLLIVGSKLISISGKDKYFEKVVMEAEEYRENIIFTGYINSKDMPAIYTVGDTLVIPSICEEAFGVNALEGMAMKIPIIATHSGGLVEILGTDAAMIVDKNSDVEEHLANAMSKMMSDNILRNEYRENAYRKVCNNEQFDKVRYYNNFLKCINE